MLSEGFDEEFFRTKIMPKGVWHRWFAWRPVRLEDGTLRWLASIERRIKWGWFNGTNAFLPMETHYREAGRQALTEDNTDG